MTYNKRNIEELHISKVKQKLLIKLVSTRCFCRWAAGWGATFCSPLLA